MKVEVFPRSLYEPRYEHDGCGVGFVASISGSRSASILEMALDGVMNLTHRGAVDADARTGDGAGVLTQIPYRLFDRDIATAGASLPRDADLAVGVLFLPCHGNEKLGSSVGASGAELAAVRGRCRQVVEEEIRREGLTRLAWRAVPVDPRCLGEKAAATMPDIQHVLIGRRSRQTADAYERSLYLVRKRIERRIEEEGIEHFCIVSLSHQRIVYKGLFVAPQLKSFYRDLRSDEYETALAVFHQRYSTNTFPSWSLAQPYRMLAHNGEINTIMGNRNWMRAREPEMHSTLWGAQIKDLVPVLQAGNSDSADLDAAIELMTLSHRDLLHAVMQLMPEAWGKSARIPQSWRDFYEYHACLNEPWDGPAAVVCSDGHVVGAALDRNGLRPARYKITDDGLIVMGSEVGLVRLEPHRVVESGRLGPGRMIAVDTRRGRLLTNDAIKNERAARRPYGSWVKEHLYRLAEHASTQAEQGRVNPIEPDLLRQQQISFGYTVQENERVLLAMAKDGKEPVGSMGDDTPLSVLSERPRLLASHFRQLFAQVTNPAIDSIREKNVMSLATYLGRRRSMLEETPEHAKLVRVPSPFLLDFELDHLRSIDDPAFLAREFPVHFPANHGVSGLQSALEDLAKRVAEAVELGTSIIVLTDRGVNRERAAIPMLLAVGAVHHNLIRRGIRMRCSIVCESAECRDVHHFATLVGYGASAVNPYLAIDVLRQCAGDGTLEDCTVEEAVGNFKDAIKKGMLKIMAKMGISTMSSYRGAQVFEAVGLGEHVIEQCFRGTSSRIGGLGYEEIARDVLSRHRSAFTECRQELDDGGEFTPVKRGEYHAYNKPVVSALLSFQRSGKKEKYDQYSQLIGGGPPVTVRDLLKFKPRRPIPLEQVEPIEYIRARFTTAAMSLGALSPEAHECLALAMNAIGGKSNSGEGGEDPARFHTLADGSSKNSAIKQVASGRFGVTIEYLASAKELEIKIAQGAKPGEGGQLPAHKVSPMIAALRRSPVGVPLISPPPHHDIYSIEDLAQLIYDLKQANPRAKVCVKLVAEAGVGTIAAGVAKAYADVILISGHDGGTGASPLTSIKYAGGPWELGLAEAHQVLMFNDLRSRVVLRTDGGMRTGRDIVIASLLGAEEYNFGTAALVAAGCAMFRVCHLNTCPTGIATQQEKLRAKFKGKPENVIAYFNGVAQEVRELLAQLGFRTIDEMIGRTDVLEPRTLDELPHTIRHKVKDLNLEALLYQPDPGGESPRRHLRQRNDRPGDVPLDDTIMQDAKDALAGKATLRKTYAIDNTRRSVGTKLSGEIGYHFGDAGLDEGSIDLTFQGSAGQSFGAFLAKGVRLRLVGEANDYVGKGMTGGEIVLMPAEDTPFVPHENVIMGNTVLYGATGGRLFACGRAGERFAVRNSGAHAVVEGAGDHCCEYMTNGIVVVLGEVGGNFAAGMSGGLAYVLDLEEQFPELYNPAMVTIEPLSDQDDIKQLQQLIYDHLDRTSSPRAHEILTRWPEYVQKFYKVVPHPPAALPESKPLYELDALERVPPIKTGGY